MAYRRGYAAVEESIEAANAAGDFTPFTLTHPIQALWNMTWKDGETKVVRFLTDGVITIGFHNFIQTRDGKRAEFVDTSQLQGELQRPDWIAAHIKDEKGKPLRPTNQTIGIVVERKLNPDTREWEDVTAEFEVPSNPDDANSEKVTVEWPRFWVIKQGIRFWSQVDAYWSDLGTTTDRNFKIKRTGSSAQNTNYTVMPDLKDDGATAASLAELYDIPAVEGYEEDPVQGHIVQWIERRGTTKWFEKLTGPTASADKPEAEAPKKPASRGTIGIKAKSTTTTGAQPDQAASEEPVDEDAPKTDSLKNKLGKYKLATAGK